MESLYSFNSIRNNALVVFRFYVIFDSYQPDHFTSHVFVSLCGTEAVFARVSFALFKLDIEAFKELS